MPKAKDTPPAAGGADNVLRAEVAVLGAGPGGYSAAFRAADLGKNTVLIEPYPTLGGVCLNVGCIPSKALLHVARVISEARAAAEFGVAFAPPRIAREKLIAWKERTLGRLTGGLAALARQRKVTVLRGVGRFVSADRLTVATEEGEKTVAFEQAVIAVGSRPVALAGLGAGDDPRVMDSTAALRLDAIPPRLLVIGGGIIGLELATVYHELGSRVTVVETLDRLLAGADADLVRPLRQRVEKQYENLYLATTVTAIEPGKDGLRVGFDGAAAPKQDTFDRVLVAVGRRPNGDRIDAAAAGVRVDERGFIPVDAERRTNVSRIFAIGDVAGPPMLAHKAAHEGKVAAEVAAGLKSAFESKVIPSVAYTDPEVAWVGLGEEEARRQGADYDTGVFPWAASGRALSLGRSEGLTKLLFDRQSGRLLGAGIVGPQAGDLIAEAALAIEMGCEAEDLALTIHPHPTLSETIPLAAEMFLGTITDLYAPKKK